MEAAARNPQTHKGEIVNTEVEEIQSTIIFLNGCSELLSSDTTILHPNINSVSFHDMHFFLFKNMIHIAHHTS